MKGGRRGGLPESPRLRAEARAPKHTIIMIMIQLYYYVIISIIMFVMQLLVLLI